MTLALALASASAIPATSVLAEWSALEQNQDLMQEGGLAERGEHVMQALERQEQHRRGRCQNAASSGAPYSALC